MVRAPEPRGRVVLAQPTGLTTMGMDSGRSKARLLSTYHNVGWVHAIVDRIGQAMAAADWQLFTEQRNGEREEIDEHPLLELLDMVNPWMTRYELFERYAQHLELTGEAYWHLVPNGRSAPMEIWPLRPDRVSPIVGNDGMLQGWRYKVGSFFEATIPPEDIISHMVPDPLDPFGGSSPVEAILSDLESEREASNWNRNFFRNSAIPAGIIALEEDVGDPQFEAFVSRWREEHQGVGNVGRIGILDMKAKWLQTGLSQKDMDFGNLREVNRITILGAFGFPSHALGIAQDVNRANAEAAEVMFSRWIVEPRLRRLKQKMNERLAPLFGEGLGLDFEDVVPANRELDLKAAVDAFNAKILTRNEARDLLGFDALEDGTGDEIGVPAPEVVPPMMAPPEEMPEEPAEERMVKALEDEHRRELSPELAEHEEVMARNWTRRLGAELARVLDDLGLAEKGIEPADADSIDWNWVDRYGDAVERELERGFLLSYVLGEGPETMAQRLAVDYASTRSTELLTNMAASTRNSVRSLIAGALDRGDSLDSLARAIRDAAVFSRARAETIARTETATAIGEGVKGAALSQGRDEKRWRTARDERVDGGNPSGPCIENAAQGWIKANVGFASGHDTIPAHPRCRCDVEWRTSSLRSARPVEKEVPMEQFRCPDCNKLLAEHPTPAASYWCRRCKQQKTAPGTEVPMRVLEGGRRKVVKTIERDEFGRLVRVIEEEAS